MYDGSDAWKALQALVGQTVLSIQMDEANLKFTTAQGDTCFQVEGDCCSSSYFYDFLGVRNLLLNGPIRSVEQIELDDSDAKPRYDECVALYGYRLITEGPLGEVTSAFSFRNDSNGYYGGWMESVRSVADSVPTLTEDCLETSSTVGS